MLSHLLLMRHAKSSWSDGSLSDHERPLNKRGEKAAIAVGEALVARGYAPDIIWSSDATRTRQTAMRLIRAIPGAQTVNYNPDFYHASLQTVLNICGKQIEPDGKLMLLGHNPGWAALHEYFTGHYHDYPTGACTIMSRNNKSDGDWLDPASWRLVDLILPERVGVMKATLTAMWRLFHALAFYPIMIGAFIWLYIKCTHWIWGALIIAGILIFDPMWRIIGQNILRMIQKK